MARTASAAADSTAPESPAAPVVEAAATPTPTPPVPTPETPASSGWGTWRYTGPPGRVYVDIPVTVDPGDVVSWPTEPGTDGCWEPDPGPATKRPDNHRPDPMEG